MGIDVHALTAGSARRPVLRVCMDGSEQEHHVAGVLGAALLESFLSTGWLVRTPGERALCVTAAGRRDLRAHLPIELDGIDVKPRR